MNDVLMITRNMEEILEKLKCYLNTKVWEQEENLSKVFNTVLNDLRKEITKQIQNEVKDHCKHLKFENQMLKHQVSELRKLNISNQNNQEKLEQYIDVFVFEFTTYPWRPMSHVTIYWVPWNPYSRKIKQIFWKKILTAPIELAPPILTIPQIKLQKYNYTFYDIPPQNYVLQSQK